MSDLKSPLAADTLDGVVRRFIVEIRGDMPAASAFDMCRMVAMRGQISGPPDRPQHCYATEFQPGQMVYVTRNKSGSERFIVNAPNNGLERTRTRSGSEVRSEPSLGKDGAS